MYVYNGHVQDLELAHKHWGLRNTILVKEQKEYILSEHIALAYPKLNTLPTNKQKE